MIFAIFKTHSGDGVWEDHIGNQYAVDTGTIGALPRKALGKNSKLYKYKRFKYPAKCRFYEPFNGCLQIGEFYIFTDYHTSPSKEEKSNLFNTEYSHKRGIDGILALIASLETTRDK